LVDKKLYKETESRCGKRLTK